MTRKPDTACTATDDTAVAHTHYTALCLDCDTPTFCNHAHGVGHDHSPAARACTAAALADDSPQ